MAADRHWTITAISAEQESTVVLRVLPTREAVPCPSCGELSRRRHSWYERKALDLPWRGATVRLRIRARRWFCDNAACAQRIFAERFEGLVARGARRTDGATDLLVELGLRAGGEGGARLARKAGVPTSPDTLLRLVRGLGEDAVPTPRVLGVDDFALRRGRRYGTLLVDLERREPIDVLPGRDAEPLVRWLAAHPGVEVLVRDRAEAYAEAGRRGAPDALQVADRFHLVQNAGAAFEEVLRGRKRHVERTVVAAVAEAPPRPPSASQQQKQAARARRVARWEEACRRRAAGESLAGIARALGTDRKTVRRLLASREVPPPRPRARPTGLASPSLQPYVPYLQDRWQDGCTNISQLHRELRDRGFTRSRSLLAQALLAWREERPPPGPDGRRPRARRRVRRHRLRWLCLRPPEQLGPDEQDALARTLAEQPELAQAYHLLHGFRRLVAQRELSALDAWLADAEASPFPSFVSFARGLRADHHAVAAALTLEWSSGPVEGEIHKVKLLKRQGYGRASTPLLRAKILAV